MRKSLLLIGLTVCMAAMPATASEKPAHPAAAARAALAKATRKAESKAPELAWFYKPGKVTYEIYDPATNTWLEPSVQNFTYNTGGSVATAIYDNELKKIYTYNSDGYLTKEEVYEFGEQGELVPQCIYTYTYDSRIPGKVVQENVVEYWEGVVAANYGYGVDITRNADGNIVKTADYRVSDGEKEYYGSALVIEYGPDKKAIKITDLYEPENSSGETIIYDEFSDIVWATTDGQIYTIEYDDYNADMYFSANRIASATLKSRNYPYPSKFTAAYKGADYHSLVMMGEERLLEIDFKCIGAFAGYDDFELTYSYDTSIYETGFDRDGDTGSYVLDYKLDDHIKNLTDAFGVNYYYYRERVYEEDNTTSTYIDHVEADADYDSAWGYPTSAVFYTVDGNEKFPVERYTYSDYVNVDPDGVASTILDENAAAEYYNLQGIRIANPENGIYIVRKGDKTSKVLIR